MGVYIFDIGFYVDAYRIIWLYFVSAKFIKLCDWP